MLINEKYAAIRVQVTEDITGIIAYHTVKNRACSRRLSEISSLPFTNIKRLPVDNRIATIIDIQHIGRGVRKSSSTFYNLSTIRVCIGNLSTQY